MYEVFHCAKACGGDRRKRAGLSTTLMYNAMPANMLLPTTPEMSNDMAGCKG